MSEKKKIQIYCCLEAFMTASDKTISDPKFFDDLKMIIESALKNGLTPFKEVNVTQLYQKELKK